MLVIVHFFLSDGQAIAIKLSKQIDKIVKSIHKTLSDVNGYLVDDLPRILYEGAKDLRRSIYSAVQEKGNTVPALIRRQMIDLFCLQNRCQEMNHLVSFLQNEIRFIDESVDALLPDTDTPFNAGLIACLKRKRMIHCNHISSLLSLWGSILDSPKPIDDTELVKTYANLDSPKPIDHTELVKTYANLSGIDYLQDENSDELSGESMMEEDVDDEAFVLELSSDSELSDCE